jgi:hypothetical protein
MANGMLGFPNRIGAATLTGGSWESNLPLTNIQHRTIQKVARTTDATLASTQLDIDLGSEKNIRVIGIRNHNFTLDATFRIRASAVSNFATTVYDSGWTDVWPVVYPFEALEWEDDNWWSGRYGAEEIEGHTTETDCVLPSNTLARYWRLEFDDTTNSAGHIQIGRIFIGPAWQFTNNMAYNGYALGLETKTEVQEARGGAEYFDVRLPYRVVRFALPWMTENEGMANAFDLLRRAGVDKEVLWIHDPDDTVHALRRRFIGRLRQLSAIEHPYPNTHSTAFEIKELL